MPQFRLNTQTSKDYLRKRCKVLRSKMCDSGAIDEASVIITEKIKKSEFFKQAKNIMIFYPKKDEINLLGLLRYKEKSFFLPRCEGKNMQVCAYKKNDKLLENKYKILEPVCEAIADLNILDLVLVPALCADKNFNRIGYGGGYYDRFFAQNNLNAKKIIVLPRDFYVDCIKCEPTDICCDGIILS